MAEIDCCFCGEPVDFITRRYDKVVVVLVEFEQDGASVARKYWAHELCLPEELTSDG